ncbi:MULTISPECIES: hypothetical protein [Saccharopolyspora]|uniref:Uncharacterized protein n=1 Tax=Saccharopolyspora aridisoli TaxID=2530385 RepID=A0A4R4UMS7_9PSEU|nr:hypothetical protein [Saccharopolyspora aridisoli]TDC88139.1 hypothetical protein E1161_24395 [Saccharopolyspora aridisoli]
MSFSRPFAPDDRYDFEHASDFQSRYGAYLRQNAAQFVDVDGQQPTQSPLEFAASAWRVAQSPVMSPAYVESHPRVLSAVPTWDFDGRLAITVEIAASVPGETTRVLRGYWRGWQTGSTWHVQEDNHVPTATAVLLLRVPIEADGLPTPSFSRLAEPSTDAAKAAVQTICGRLNAALSGVFAQFARKEVA